VALTAAGTRVMTAAVLVPLVVLLILGAPAAIFHAVIVLLSAAGVWELGRLFERAGRPSAGWPAAAAGAVVTASFVVAGGPVPALTLAVLATLAAPILSRRGLSTDLAATTLLGLTWVSWLLGHAVLLRQLPGGAELVLLLAGVTWAGETAAYAVGSSLGRYRLAPVISPQKTVEGAAAQVVASVVAAFVLHPWLAPAWSPGWVLAAGLLLGVLGQVGDLAESVVKRSLGAKDTGGLIPGHGGVLDRLDGLLFNLPVFYYLAALGGAGR
jgi:phosphatidate cytidylyltransferase